MAEVFDELIFAVSGVVEVAAETWPQCEATDSLT
jgi:hypothetical protein